MNPFLRAIALRAGSLRSQPKSRTRFTRARMCSSRIKHSSEPLTNNSICSRLLRPDIANTSPPGRDILHHGAGAFSTARVLEPSCPAIVHLDERTQGVGLALRRYAFPRGPLLRRVATANTENSFRPKEKIVFGSKGLGLDPGCGISSACNRGKTADFGLSARYVQF